jgi:hypothetical protein
MALALKREELVNRRDGYGVSGHVTSGLYQGEGPTVE